MNIQIIASSSDGNCTHIYSEKANILIDIGIAARTVVSKTGRKAFDAIFISHEHADHIRGAGTVGRATGAPIYINEHVYNKSKHILRDCNIVLYDAGESIIIGDLEIQNFSSRHDSVYSYGYIVKHDEKRLAYLTDTGSWTKLMLKHLKDCDAYILETDYDHDALMAYEYYDDFLKERISSNWGHLGNDQTMRLIKQLKVINPAFIVFAHLSKRTNTSDLVLAEAYSAFPDWNKDIFKVAPLDHELIL